MTVLELQVIRAIFTSDYAWGSGVEGAAVVGTPVWAFSVADGLDAPKASHGGMIGSCAKKGWVEFSSYEENDDCIALTRAGFDAYVAAGGEFPTS